MRGRPTPELPKAARAIQLGNRLDGLNGEPAVKDAQAP
jgi:hypothetical protein